MMIENKLLCIGIFIILLSFVIDIRLGLVVSTTIFGFFIVHFCKTKYNPVKESYEEGQCYSQPKYLPNKISAPQKYQNPTCLGNNCTKINMDPFKIQPVIVNKNMRSQNHELEGAGNPKTRIPPMVTRPCYSLDWRKNTMIVPNVINGESNENLYLSGYIPQSDQENPLYEQSSARKMKTRPISTIEDTIENYNENDVEYGEKNWSDKVYTPNGYDAIQFEQSKFPANLPQGAYPREPLFSDYNNKMFTQTVQPGVYYKDNVIEPVNSNIGISFQQEFLPRTYDETPYGLEIVDHDPNFAPAPTSIIEPVVTPNIDNTYDPRMYGYGTSYRNYVDEVTGQPRFPYDDINAVKMPNYIVRSKIDTFNFADTYGSVQNGGISLNSIRDKAQDAFLQDNLTFRNDMMTRLMRKRNAELWQTRQSPLSGATSGRMLSGGR
jgi:hypothetical protein